MTNQELESKIEYLFENHSNYDVCMLSHIIQKSCEIPENELDTPLDGSQGPILRKVLNGQTASGYLVNSNFLDRLICLYEWSCPLLETTNHHWLYANDMVWKGLQPENRWYYFTPSLGKQIDSYSDNKQCFSTYNS